jgi:uncharacterized protein YhbP (UPF0306 family)
MEDKDLRSEISAYFGSVKMMHLATSDGENPWVCNVWFASDNDFNIYWISSTNRRHSQEIARNPHVAASFCIPSDPSDTSAGALQLEGVATELSKPLEIAKALKLYVARGFFSLAQVKKFMGDLHHPHRFYKITPERIVHFGKSTSEYRP